MTGSRANAFVPINLKRQGADYLAIDWKDGHHSIYSWQNLRNHCPCAACQEERIKPADPFRILNTNELSPLRAVEVSPVGHYAYKITWSDGHDSGIYTLENLRGQCECPACRTEQLPALGAANAGR